MWQQQPGMIQTVLSRSEKCAGALCTVTVWKSKANFQTFMQTDEVAALLKSEHEQHQGMDE